MGPAEGKPGEVYYPLELRDTPMPAPQGSEVLIEMSAAALKHRDYFLRQHLYPGTALGTTLLADGCGTVVALGEKASPSWLHKRVIINPGIGWKESSAGPEDPSGWYSLLGGTKYYDKGTLTEYLVIDQEQIAEAPSHLTDVEAAALPVTGTTAWRALVTKAGPENIQPGSNILITGIGGGVALMALSFAVARGVNVWVTSSSDDKIQRAVSMGARGGVSYREKNWDSILLRLLPRDRPYFDAIVDGAGGDIVDRGVRLLKTGGVIAVYGMTLAPRMDFLMKAVLKNIDVKGSTMGSLKEFREMVRFVQESGIRPVVARVADGIENIPAIDSLFQDMGSGKQFGKLVVRIKNNSPSSKL
ncbi:hypothetical protein ACJ41O_003126 [Fusarium nematophilum]